ncbi:PHP protein [Candidatus Zixiibacteriota bacterium]|nr:PHP protein [candidate division Zixibacteria bacterium]
MIKNGKYFEYKGCIHIHTTESDGTKTLEEVTDIASDAGLDFILVSDHMTLKCRNEGKEGFYRGTLVLIGYEHNDVEDCNHYLLFGTKEVLGDNLTPQEYVAEGKRQGALGIIAHPDEIRPRLGKYPSYPWLAWDAVGFDGVEIWNQMSEWMENLKPYNKVKMVFSPRRFMRSPTDRILQKWDDLNLMRKVAGLGAVDVHGFPYRIGPIRITIFPYKVQFRSLRTHVLLTEKLSQNLERARDQIYEAIRDCRIFVSNFRWGEASGFDFRAIKDDDYVIGGGSMPGPEEVTLSVKVPERGSIRLICNSHEVARAEGDSLNFRALKRGIYRAEVYKKDKGWIFSNHIRIGL